MLLSSQDFPELNTFLDAHEAISLDCQPPQQSFSAILPELYPSLPLLGHRAPVVGMPNPFIKNSTEHYLFENRMSFAVPEDGEVNGYIKFRLRVTEASGNTRQPKKQATFDQVAMAVHHRRIPGVPTEKLPYLPPDFGRTMRLDPTDHKLLRFCKLSTPVSVLLISGMADLAPI